MTQRIRSINKDEVDQTVNYYQSQGFQVVKRGSSYINRTTQMHWAIIQN